MYYIFYNRVKWTSLSKKEKKYDWERTNQLKYIILLKIAIEGRLCPKRENLLQGENELVFEIYFTLNGGSNGSSLSKKGKFIIGKERTSIKLIIRMKQDLFQSHLNVCQWNWLGLFEAPLNAQSKKGGTPVLVTIFI